MWVRTDMLVITNFFPPRPHTFTTIVWTLTIGLGHRRFQPLQPQRNTLEHSKLRGNKSKQNEWSIHCYQNSPRYCQKQSPVVKFWKKKSLGEGCARVKRSLVSLPFFFMFYFYIASSKMFPPSRYASWTVWNCSTQESGQAPFFVLVLSSTFSQPSGQGLTMKPGHMRNKLARLLNRNT